MIVTLVRAGSAMGLLTAGYLFRWIQSVGAVGANDAADRPEGRQ